MEDLSTDEEDRVHNVMRGYEHKIDNLMSEVGTLKNEVVSPVIHVSCMDTVMYWPCALQCSRMITLCILCNNTCFLLNFPPTLTYTLFQRYTSDTVKAILFCKLFIFVNLLACVNSWKQLDLKSFNVTKSVQSSFDGLAYSWMHESAEMTKSQNNERKNVTAFTVWWFCPDYIKN